MEGEASNSFHAAFKGRFESVLRWEQLDVLHASLVADADGGWYIYAVGEAPPESPASREEVLRFLTEVMALLRREHSEEFCGIVYVDSLQQPAFVKFFDPNNLGVSCGYSDSPPLPGWILSKMAPADLRAPGPLPGNRRRWWQRLFG